MAPPPHLCPSGTVLCLKGTPHLVQKRSVRLPLRAEGEAAIGFQLEPRWSAQVIPVGQ